MTESKLEEMVLVTDQRLRRDIFPIVLAAEKHVLSSSYTVPFLNIYSGLFTCSVFSLHNSASKTSVKIMFCKIFAVVTCQTLQYI